MLVAVTISKAVYPPPNRVNSSRGVRRALAGLEGNATANAVAPGAAPPLWVTLIQQLICPPQRKQAVVTVVVRYNNGDWRHDLNAGTECP